MHPSMNMKFFGSNTMGEKGQVVIPVEGRQTLGMSPGDKLIFMGNPDKGIMIIAKAEVFEEHMSNIQASFESVRDQIKKKSK